MTDAETIANLEAQLKSAVATAESLNETIVTQSQRIRVLEAELAHEDADDNEDNAENLSLQKSLDDCRAKLREHGL